MKQARIKGGELIVQHNHMVNARFSMTANEMRLFVFMLSEIKKTDTQFKMIEVPVELFRNSSGNVLYQDIRNAADRITQRRIAIQNINGGKNFQFIPLMSICAYQEGEGCIKARFNDEVKPYLLQLGGNFTASQIKQLLMLKSYYAHRMYWLLKQYQDFGSRTIEVKELRAILELANKYKRYLDFRIRVLDKAREELEQTDMQFDYEEVRKGKSVHSIRFIFSKGRLFPDAIEVGSATDSSPAPPADSLAKPPQHHNSPAQNGKVPVKEILDKYGFSERQLRNILSSVDEKDIYKTNYALQCEKSKIPAASLTGYAYSVFKKKFMLKDED